jgi:hypothetical protein
MLTKLFGFCFTIGGIFELVKLQFLSGICLIVVGIVFLAAGMYDNEQKGKKS